MTIGPSTVRFARRPTRGVLLGFSAIRCGVIGLAFVTVLLGLLLAGGWGLIVTAPLWTTFAASAFVTRKGEPLVEWFPVALHWLLRVSANQTEYRVRVMTPRPAGTMALPGDAAPLRFYDDPEHRDVLHSRSTPPDAGGGPRGVALRLRAARPG